MPTRRGTLLRWGGLRWNRCPIAVHGQTCLHGTGGGRFWLNYSGSVFGRAENFRPIDVVDLELDRPHLSENITTVHDVRTANWGRAGSQDADNYHDVIIFWHLNIQQKSTDVSTFNNRLPTPQHLIIVYRRLNIQQSSTDASTSNNRLRTPQHPTIVYVETSQHPTIVYRRLNIQQSSTDVVNIQQSSTDASTSNNRLWMPQHPAIVRGRLNI